jgi:DNA-binding transcriptional regulator LsrR (DeoR family)
MTTGPEREHLELLLTVARWYYLDAVSQEDIARRIQFSRSSVSRLLAEARRRRIVRFEVGHPMERAMSLEAELVSRFGIKGARVAEVQGSATAMSSVAAFAAELVAEVTEHATVVTVSNGTTVSAVVSELPRLHRRDTCIVQMIGALGKDNPLDDSPEITRRMADSFDCDYRLMPAPLLVGNRRLASALRREEPVANALALGSHADVALTGVGSFTAQGSGAIFGGWQTPEMIHDLSRRGAVGHICGHHFTADGRHIEHDLCHRIMAVPLERLRDIRTVVGVAFGTAKVPAIRGALNGGYLGLLVTDTATAQTLLKD